MTRQRLSVILIFLCLEQVFVDGFLLLRDRDQLNQQIDSEWNARKCFETNLMCKGDGATCKDDGRTCNCPDGLIGDDCGIKEGEGATCKDDCRTCNCPDELLGDDCIKEAEAVCNDDGTAVFTFMVNTMTDSKINAVGDETSDCKNRMRTRPVANGNYVQYQLTLNYEDVSAQSDDCARLMVKDFRTISMDFTVTIGNKPSKQKHMKCVIPAEAANSNI